MQLQNTLIYLKLERIIYDIFMICIVYLLFSFIKRM